MSQKSLPFPSGFAVIRIQFDAAGEGRPHRWYAADGSDGVSLEYGPAAFLFSYRLVAATCVAWGIPGRLLGCRVRLTQSAFRY